MVLKMLVFSKRRLLCLKALSIFPSPEAGAEWSGAVTKWLMLSCLLKILCRDLHHQILCQTYRCIYTTDCC